MKRSSPTLPDPHGGPPKRGCLYMSRFVWLLLGLLWVSVWLAMRDHSVGHKLRVALGFSVPVAIVFLVPLFGLAERLEIRRYCRSRGLKILKHKWRGVIYMDGDVKRYSRWPDDFLRSPDGGRQ